MTNQLPREDAFASFADPSTQERWLWVKEAINAAESSSMKALEDRAQTDDKPAPPLFD
ncbi:MAG: hypothetical protein AAAFM81_10890 [Pseudomonadota bacterium]